MRKGLVLWAAALAAGVMGCGGDSDETLVVVHIERGTTAGSIDRIELDLELGGMHAMRTLTEGSQALTLPLSAGFRVRSGEGSLLVSARAFNGQTEIAHGSKRGQVVAGGTLSLTVVLGVDDVMLDGGPGDGGGDAVLALDKTSHDFGIAVQGSPSAPVTFTVTNTGSAASGALTSMITGAGATAFSKGTDGCQGMTLAPSASCTVQVVFSPTGAGAASATLQLSATPGGALSASLTGTGVSSDALTIAPTSHDFGNVVMSQPSTPVTLTVTNTGSAVTGALSASLSGSDMSQFAIGSNGCNGQTLAASATCTLQVTFTPTSAGIKTASLLVSGTPGGAATTALTGTGVGPAMLAVTPPTQDFGTVVTSNNATVSITVRNAGGAMTGVPSAAISGSADFTIMNNGCTAALAPAASCTIAVRFAPSSMGAKTGTLTVMATPGGTATAALSGTGATPGALTISPTTHDFGGVLLGMMSTTQTFTITNTGGSASGTLATTITGTRASDFEKTADTCNTMTLGAGLTCVVTLRFHANVRGAAGASLSVTGSPGGIAQASLQGTGQAPPSLTLSPTTTDFGTVTMGQTATQVFTLRNDGDASTGTLTINVTGTDFTISANGCTTPLAGAASCMITVQYAPSAAGARSGGLTASGAAGGSASATLTGNGQTAASLSASPTTVAFGGVTVGSTSAVMMYTLSNSGQATSTAITLTASAGFAIQAPTGADCRSGVTTLGGGQACTVRLTFTPSAAGAVSGGMSTFAASQGGSGTVTLTGTGLTPANLALSPGTLTYTTVVGQSSDDMVVVTNSGQSQSGPLGITLTGPADFAIVTGLASDCAAGAMLAGGASCNVRIRFTPGSRTSFSATLTVSATPGGSRMATINGTGQAPATLTVTPTPHSFPLTEVGQTSGTQNFTFRNTGDVASTALAISSTNAAEFPITSNGCMGMTLAPNGVCTVTMAFRPGAGAAASGSVTATATGASATAMLSGSGGFRLTVALGGGSTGTVTSVPAGVNCGADCNELYAGGTSVTLQARVSNGSGVMFGGWSGGGCSGVFRDCAVTVSASVTVTANFAPIQGNLVFVTSQTITADRGGLMPYDTLCNTLATAAGINDASNTAYRAWMSTSTSNATDRFALAQSFITMDGLVFGQKGPLLSNNQVLNPIRHDEQGRDRPYERIITGTDQYGFHSASCNDWMGGAIIGVAFWGGMSGRGPGGWSNNVLNFDCTTPQRLYCMMYGARGTVTPATTAGKRIWVSQDMLFPSAGADPNATCLMFPPSGVTSSRALIARTTGSAAGALVPAQTYIRPDGVRIGTGAEIIAAGVDVMPPNPPLNALRSGIWQWGNGTYDNSEVWTGAFDLTTPGDAVSTCNDWQSSGGQGQLGSPWDTNRGFFAGRQYDCSVSRPVYCVEQ